MDPSVIEEVRLTSFKSFRGARVRLSELTLLIGRNGAGKSNALDALEVLSRLASGDDIRDALEGGRRDTGPIRGGAEGCAPRKEKTFSLGCTVRTGRAEVSLDVEVQLEPTMQILSEQLSGPTAKGYRPLIATGEADPDRADIDAHWWNGKQGPNPILPFRASRLLTSQVPTRVPATDSAGQAVHRAAEQVLAALGAVFHLDPVPHLMRQYVQERDIVLRRTAENLSAVIRHLSTTDKAAYEKLADLLATLPEQELSRLVVERSSLGDVMLAVKERQGRRSVTIPARLMSDGMLRFLAIATALLSSAQPEVRELAAVVEATGGRTLVIEELENGLHPTQAARVLKLLTREGRHREVHTLATTHSPALLSAVAGEDHDGVYVCDRDAKTGLSRLRPLPELPGYAAAMAKGTLGDAVTKGLLGVEYSAKPTGAGDFERLVGIG
jgi:predicted ATPase